MDVKLTVVLGKHAGQQIPIPTPKFFIGRAEDCNLRAHSDQVSRHHCVIVVEEGYVAVRDFQSKNGTFVNGQRIAGESELKHGDRLKVGQIELDVHIGAAVAGKKAAGVQPGEKGLDLGDRSAVADDSDTVTILPTDLARLSEAAGKQAGPAAEPKKKKLEH
jgi:pSer/pThr/pTyr-binding forkhead associated (FHA) protein